MKSKLIFVLILHICFGQWNHCSDDKERQSTQEIKKCFLENASLDPCTEYDCSGKSVCNSNNVKDDVACLINLCQRKCKSREKPCIIECLNLDSCNEREAEEHYMDCIRNSAVNGQLKNCFDNKERQSTEEISQCFLDNASGDPCLDYNCSKDSVCNSSNLISDVACLTHFCQKKCKSKEKPCVIECLNLDSCNQSETEEEYMDCIRNSTVNGQFKSCFNDNERPSKEEIKECFLDNVSSDPCIDYNCSEGAVCNTSNLNDDVACLINTCQTEGKLSNKSHVFECLGLGSCSKSETGQEYMDCIRNSTADYCRPYDLICEMRKCLKKGKTFDECIVETSPIKFPKRDYPRWNDPPPPPPPADPFRDSRKTTNPYGQKTQRNGLVSSFYLIIVIFVVIVVLISASLMLVGFLMFNRGNVSSHTPAIDPRAIPKGNYPVQMMPIIAPGPIVQQSPGPGLTPYPVGNQFETIRRNQTT